MIRLLVFTLLACPVLGRASSGDTLTIVHLNDTHSNLSSHGPRDPVTLTGTRGGIARAATFVGMIRQEESNVVFLHAGDLFVGDIMFNTYFGVPELALLQMLGLDAIALGNHEFDLTPYALNMTLDSSAAQGMVFPFLSQNTILDSAEVSPLKNYVKPSAIVQKGSIKVGIIGLTTPETNFLSLPGPAVVDTPRGDQMYAEIVSLRGQGCSVIVVLSHLGKSLDQEIAAGVPGIDVIVGGHDHDVLTEPIWVQNPTGGTTPIVQAGAFYEYIGKVRFVVNESGAQFLDYGLTALDESVPETPDIAAVVAMLEAGAEEKFGPMFSDQVWYDSTAYEELLTGLAGVPEARSDVGDLVTRSFQWAGGTDIGLVVGGATAQPLPQGPVVRADIHRMIGYGYNQTDELGFQLARFRISGIDLWKGIEWGLSELEKNDEYFPMGFPLRFLYTSSRAPFDRLDAVWVGDSLLVMDAVYSVTSSEFILAVLRDFVGPQLGITILDPEILTDTTEFEAVLWYLGAHPEYSPSSGTQSVEYSAPVPGSIVLDQNFPNPFNPTTTIRYAIASDSHVRLNVFNILGQEVAIPVNGKAQAGSYSTTWNANVASGVYFYRLEAVDDQTGLVTRVWRKMMLIR